MKSVSEIKKNIEGLITPYGQDGIDPCNCVEKLVIWTHGSPGTLQLNTDADKEVLYGRQLSNTIETLDRRIRTWKIKNEWDRKHLEDMKKESDWTKEKKADFEALGGFMCRGSTVVFESCRSGCEESGEELKQMLDEVFKSSTVEPLNKTYVFPFFGFSIPCNIKK